MLPARPRISRSFFLTLLHFFFTSNFFYFPTTVMIKKSRSAGERKKSRAPGADPLDDSKPYRFPYIKSAAIKI
jgi:hypothetical protein